MLSKELIDLLREIISQIKEIQISYVFGSSLKEKTFNDIDIAVLISNTKSSYQASKFAMSLGRIIEKSLKFKWEVDVKILNYAPIYFQFSVLQEGVLLFYQNENDRISYEKNVITDYLDFRDTLDWFDVQIIGRD
ncbi:MAG TPA: nucleotidyltransferase domain-containing protein [Candidatus Deferrimicrobium sp.]|nr:nucleotidyltransferase domain-containing protein [Candidatus Deferrimicrobium sp.]